METEDNKLTLRYLRREGDNAIVELFTGSCPINCSFPYKEIEKANIKPYQRFTSVITETTFINPTDKELLDDSCYGKYIRTEKNKDIAEVSSEDQTLEVSFDSNKLIKAGLNIGDFFSWTVRKEYKIVSIEEEVGFTEADKEFILESVKRFKEKSKSLLDN